MNCFTKICIATVMPLFLYSQEQESNHVEISSNSKQISFSELTVENGLSQNSVVSIAQDSIGYMWFATQDGLNKYDGRSFTFYNKQFEDVTRPTYSKLGKIYVDRTGALWLISNSGILERFDENNDRFRTIKEIPKASCLLQHSNLDYYIGTYNKGLYHINSKTKDTLQIFKNTFRGMLIFDIREIGPSIYVTTSNHLFKIHNSSITKEKVEGDPKNFSVIVSSSDKTIWLGTFGKGLYYKTKAQNEFVQYKLEQLPKTLNIQDLLVDKNDHLWIATYGDGAYRLDINTGIVKHFIANKNDPYALHYDDVLCLYEDYTGAIWLGTDGAGLSYYDEHHKKFNTLTNDQTPKDVHVDVVRAITVDDKNMMWLGTSGKGLTSVNSASNSFKTYTVQNSEISSDRIMSLLYHNGELWIGHQGKGLQILDASGKFRSFSELNNKTIWKIYKDKTNRIWLCTRDSGLICYDKKRGVINEFTMENSALTSNNIRTVEEGNTNHLWIGTENNGLFFLNTLTNRIKKVDKIPDKIKSLYFSNDMLWIGSNGSGLIVYNLKSEEVQSYTIQDGLPNNVIYSILPDAAGDLWLSSNKGITKFNLNDPSNSTVENYSSYSGLQAFEFNTGAYFKDEKGQLYFGGLEGVNWFDPSGLTHNKVAPKTAISKFEIFGKEYPMVNGTTYPHHQNTMTFTFAGLHFSQPERNLYRYKLVNHDADWSVPEHSNVAHYTNLPPNEYTFMVMSSNYDGEWNREPETYSFEILKAWYATNFAKAIYVTGILMLIFGVYRYLKFRWEVKTQLRLEHAETERLKKLDEFKTKLYTNISHEFRTPLTLISGPIENQLAKPNISIDDYSELNLIQRNAKRLLNLVNQLLDLSKLESGNLKLEVGEGNLSILLKQLAKAFEFKAKEKNLKFAYEIDNMSKVWFDRDLIEKIVSNLLANAVKYTPKNGSVSFEATLNEEHVSLSFLNNGNNLKDEELPVLFQRYYQNNKQSEGVGIGLSLVKELTVLSHGNIVAHTLNQDEIQFVVTLPVARSYFNASEVSQPFHENISLREHGSTQRKLHEKDKKQNEKPILLVVEDDEDIRTFIKSIFKNEYKILEASNGKEGIRIGIKQIPDIIISDIMMPLADGIELCNTLKTNVNTSHIPIVLLTAKSGDQNEIEGLKSGADAYVTKPFNSKKLKIQIEKLIDTREKIQEYYRANNELDFHNIQILNAEEQFFEKLQEVLKDHILQSSFNSANMSKLLHMSRMQLHRKLKALTGLTTSEFIKNERLKLAVSLLKKSDLTISEIAYQTGFNTPSYFNKCFKETYNCTPKEYLLKTKK